MRHIEAGSVGNVILFSRDLTNGAGPDRNIRSTKQLGALTQRHGLEERILLTVSAGSALLIFAQNMKGMDFDPDFPKKAHEPLARLVREGRIPEERLRESWDRIAAMKRKRR